MSQNVPKDRVRIFNREGFPVAEFRASVERSWSVADGGRALFKYPSRKTDVVNEKALNFGNWLLVESDTLPAWVGVIDTPRKWSPRTVEVYAYSPERVFAWRRGPLELKLSGTAGDIFAKLINRINEAEPTCLRAGDVFTGGVQREETLNPTTLDENLRRVTDRSGEEYTFRPITDASGRLIVYGDWYERLGVDTGIMLQEGKGGGNIEGVDNILVEDGDILNDLLAYGDGSTWNTRANTVITDSESLGKYGLRQGSEDYRGVTNVSTLLSNGRKKIAKEKNPIRTFHINALNVGDTFKYLSIGNRMLLRLQNIGFMSGGLGYETTVRITAMAYDPQIKNKIELTVEEMV